MSSREKILAAVKQNQPSFVELPSLQSPDTRGIPGASGIPDPSTRSAEGEDLLLKNFQAVLESIGGTLYVVPGFDAIEEIIRKRPAADARIVSTCPELSAVAEIDIRYQTPQELANIDLAIIRAHFGVAENAAVWVTEELLPERALPFICEHLAVVLHRKDLVATMHEAYDRIGSADYGFGVFIAGPSKTADIEQSLVLGAHGPGTMMVFLLDSTSY
jgi:L-lactate dehydrogenase complex protein LldG